MRKMIGTYRWYLVAVAALMTTLMVVVHGDNNVLSQTQQHDWKQRQEELQVEKYRGRSEADSKGPRGKDWGDAYFAQGMYTEAAMYYWSSVLFHTQTPADLTYDVQEVFGKFLQCYRLLGKPVDGLAFVSLESFRRGQTEMGHNFLKQALSIDPDNEKVLAVKREFIDSKTKKPGQDETETTPSSSSTTTTDAPGATTASSSHLKLDQKSPEELYEVASGYFSSKDYETCADIFELSCQKSGETLGPSCANAVYCRSMIADWGFNGTQFDADMERIARITQSEAASFRANAVTMQRNYLDVSTDAPSFAWQRATSVHPHMMLGYPLNDFLLKRFVAESVAYMDEMMARADLSAYPTIPPLPDDLPYSTDPQPWVDEKSKTMATSDDGYRIRVGFVGSGFNSKAVMFLSHDMFRFFDTNTFEIHIFSFGPPDSPLFLKHGMRGVDWRKRVQSNVYKFHDLQNLLNEHIKAARYIREQGIHILIEWDGYARQGERAQGVFGLRPAPIQMLHQEYLGSSGALYVDYHFTDLITSPVEKTETFFTEKLIYMPNHFFSKGHAMQAEVHPPTYHYEPRKGGIYELGTGSPQENRCLAPADVGPEQVSFVFCNWNKMLKNNPETVRSWIRILREVPNSILCLLDNPKTGTMYLRKFVHETAGTLKNAGDKGSTGNQWEDFVSDDGDELNSRIHFLPWERSPFDHQRRNVDFCNAMLDSFPYNGHTVAQDSLYAGVPIVTRSDGLEMSARVTTSANVVLGLDNTLNAYDGPRQYEELAIVLATNSTLFQATRTTLIDTCLQRNPMHPYWDVPRYVKNFERGLQIAWDIYLSGERPQHIFVQESPKAQEGTYDEEILSHPPVGPNLVEEDNGIE